MLSAQQDEEFTCFENKVDEVMKILNLMSSEDKAQAEEGIANANNFLGIKEDSHCEDGGGIENVDIDNFLVKTNYDRTIINKKDSPSADQSHTQDAQAFMEAVERDANKRAAERKQRENIAQELRKYEL
jgi:hypothetical protein